MPTITQKTLKGLNPLSSGSIQIDSTSTIYSTTGGTIIKHSLKNPSNPQKILHLHDNKITAFNLSKNGRYLASGQMGTENYKTKKAFIAIISTEEMLMKKFFMEFEEEILDLKFSLDSRYLAATGKDHNLMIYCLENFSLIFKKKEERDFPILNWALKNGRNTLVMVNKTKIRRFEISKKLNDENFVEEKYIMLVKHIKRDYLTTSLDNESGFLFGGTASGEISVFNLNSNVFVDSIKVSDYNVTALKVFKKNCILASFLNGDVKELSYCDKKFKVLNQINTRSNICEFALNLDFPEYCFFITKDGEVFNKNSNRLSFDLFSNYPFEEIIDCGIYNKNILCLFSKNGICYFWDLITNTLISNYKPETKKTIFSQRLFINSKLKIAVLSYSDNSIIGIDLKNIKQGQFKKLWQIPEAHKGKITSIFYSEKYLLTSCSENLLRIWHSKKMTLIQEFNYHNSSIEKCKGFLHNPELIISSSKDKQMILYDLKKEKRIRNYRVKNGFIKFITEVDENLIIASGPNCPIFFFDLKNDKFFKKIDSSSICNLEIDSGKRFLAFVDSEIKLNIYDLEKDRVVCEEKIGYMNVLRIFWVSKNEIVAVMKNGGYLKLDVNF